LFRIFDIFRKERKRKSFTPKQKRDVLKKQKNICAVCKEEFEDRPHYHHKDGDVENNQTSNAQAVHPNCHDKITTKQTKSRNKKKKEKKGFGLGDLSLDLGLGEDKPKKKKRTSSRKTKTKKKSKQSEDGFSWLEYNPDNNSSKKSSRKKKSDDGWGWLDGNNSSKKSSRKKKSDDGWGWLEY